MFTRIKFPPTIPTAIRNLCQDENFAFTMSDEANIDTLVWKGKAGWYQPTKEEILAEYNLLQQEFAAEQND